VTVEKDMKSVDGGVLTDGMTWQFSSMRPRVDATSPTDGYMYASPAASVSAIFNQNVDPISAAKHFVVYDSNNKPVPGQVR